MKTTLAIILAVLSSAACFASAETPATQTTAAATSCKWQAETVDVKALKPHRRHPLVSFVKGVHKEIDYRFDEAAKDMVFVFSAQSGDPYDRQSPPPADKPYEKTKLRLADGSVVSVIKFPDASERIIGGANDGAVLLPANDGGYRIKYPDGTQGTLVRVTADEYRLTRPDNSITRVTRQSSGKYKMSNDKMKYPAEAVTDAAGNHVELH